MRNLMGYFNLLTVFLFANQLSGQSVEFSEASKIEFKNKYHFTKVTTDKYLYIYKRTNILYEVKNLNNNFYGYIDSISNEIIPCIFDKLSFYDNLLLAEKGSFKGFYDLRGKLLIPIEFNKLIPVGTNKWIAGKQIKEGVYSLSDDSASLVIPLKYENIRYEISNDRFRFVVTQDSLKGIFDYEGKLLIPFNYTGIDGSGLSFTHYLVNKNNKYGIIDSMNNIIVPIDFDQINGFRLNRLTPAKKGKWGLINDKGKFVIKPTYDDMFFYQNDEVLRVRKNGKCGFLNKKGKLVIPCIYDDANAGYYYDVLPVKKGNKISILNKKGKELMPFRYEGISKFYEGFAIVNIDNKYGIIDNKGNTVIPVEYKTINFDRDCSCFIAKSNIGIIKEIEITNGKLLMKD